MGVSLRPNPQPHGDITDTRFDWIMNCLQESDHLLTTWEFDFVSSIRDWWDERGWLTEKQQETLESIYGRKMQWPRRRQ
jgi:hypothetical protein